MQAFAVETYGNRTMMATGSSCYRAPRAKPGQKKGRPYGRPCIALDCCAPYMHPCTPETSLQLALPAPIKRIGTSLSASLLKINICQHQISVKQILIFLTISLRNYYISFINNDLYIFHFFNILKKNMNSGPIWCLDRLPTHRTNHA